MPTGSRVDLAAANGWAAAIVLLAAAATRTPIVEREGRGHVFDYIAQEVFGRLPAQTREVLLRTSPLATADAGIVASLTENPRAPEVLADLARGGWFTERLAGTRPAYRYHALFREFLLSRAREEMGDGVVAKTRRRAAALVAGQGDSDAALSLLADACAWDDLVKLVIERGPSMLVAGRSEALGRWIDHLPAAYLEAVPWLLYWRGLARFPGDPRGAIAAIDDAHDAFIRVGDAIGAYRTWASAVDIQFFALEDMAPLDRLIAELDDLRARFPEFPDPDTEAAVVAAVLCAFVNRRASDPRLEPWEERALAIALELGDLHARMNVGRQLGMHMSFWTADLVRARIVFDALRPLATASGADVTDALVWHVGEANWHAHTGDGEAARAVADRGLEIAIRSGVRLWDPVLLSVKVFGALADDDLAAAAADLAALEAVVEGAPRLSLCAHRYTAGVVALRQGEITQAVERSRAAAHLAEDAHHPLAVAAARVTWAAAAARGGGDGPSLETTAREAIAAGYTYGAVGARFVAATLALERGDEDAAAETLAEALPMARRIGCLNAVWSGRADIAELCAFALELGIETDLALRVARTRELPAGHRARSLVAWPWRIRIEALGGLRIAYEDGPLPNRKPQRKPLELLRLLVAYGPNGVRTEAAANALWPEAAGDAAGHALETTVYRLRRLLGDPTALSQRGGRLALDPARVFVDAWAVEALADRAEKLKRRGALDAARRVSEAAARLDRGDLFGDEPDPSLSFARERLRRLTRRLGIAS